MPNIKPNNPAARLFLILDSMKGSPNNLTIGAVWSRALGIPEGSKLCSQIGMVLSLPREIQKQLQRLPDYDVHDMAWWEPLSGKLTHFGLREVWQNASGATSEEILGPIRKRAKTLSYALPEPVLQESVIQELREQIVQLKAALKNEDGADTDLIEYFSRRLENMKDLLDDIKIVGAVGVKNHLETVINEVDSRADEIREEVTPQTWARWEGLMKKAQTVFLTITLAGSATATVVTGFKLLTAGTQQVEDLKAYPAEPPDKGLPPSQNEDEPTDAEFKVAKST